MTANEMPFDNINIIRLSHYDCQNNIVYVAADGLLYNVYYIFIIVALIIYYNVACVLLMRQKQEAGSRVKKRHIIIL